ncbi:MAG: restriction endonuclease subunit S, partial [Muribaculaceae bacterium]|nr:restriction endonuclease subunit S [Muribaculaceae bacterium]
TKAFYFEKAKYAKGFKVTHISTKEIAKIPIPVPPLSLQQEFAEKVEAIERQKALVQQSIEETQTLFDYTMDKYFG